MLLIKKHRKIKMDNKKDKKEIKLYISSDEFGIKNNESNESNGFNEYYKKIRKEFLKDYKPEFLNSPKKLVLNLYKMDLLALMYGTYIDPKNPEKNWMFNSAKKLLDEENKKEK